MIDLEAIKARCEAATPGPWEWMSPPWTTDPRVLVRRIGDNVEASFQVIDADPSGGEYSLAIDPGGPDAAFIAHARTDVPALVAEVEQLRKALDEARRDAKEDYARAEQAESALAAPRYSHADSFKVDL